MKIKKLSAIFIALAVVSLCTLNIFAGAKVEGDKETVAYIGSVNIDGEIDSIWDSVPGLTVDVLKENASAYFGDASKVYGVDYAKLTVKTLWDPDKAEFYVLFIVEDKEISLVGGNDWEKDSIELFIDEDNVRDGAFDGNSHQIRVLAQPGEVGDGVLYKAFTKITTTGYIVEFAYMFQEPVKASEWIGIDFQVNDDAEGNGVRHACVGWSDPVDKASSDNTYWGQLYLSDILIHDAEAYNYEYVNQSDLNVAMEEAAKAAVEVVEEAVAESTSTAVADKTPAPQTSDGIVLFVIFAVIASAIFVGVKKVRN